MHIYLCVCTSMCLCFDVSVCMCAQTYMSIKYNALSKRLCAWAVEKARIEFRAYNMARDDLRPRAYGRLR